MHNLSPATFGALKKSLFLTKSKLKQHRKCFDVLYSNTIPRTFSNMSDDSTPKSDTEKMSLKSLPKKPVEAETKEETTKKKETLAGATMSSAAMSKTKKNLSDVGPSSSSNSSISPWSSPRPKTRNQHLSVQARSQSVQQRVKTVVPKLTHDLYKGQCGRICVFGGCIMYTGAPYFAAISALKTGADLVHVMCEKEAGQVIKSYSPELIVHPILDTEYALEEIDHWLPRFHAVVLGPGLGRNQSMLGRISIIIEKVKSANIPLIIDADGLWHLINSPMIIKGFTRAILTPNAMEFSRLAQIVLKNENIVPNNNPDTEMVQQVARALGGVTIVHKGSVDVISNGKFVEKCVDEGCPRRCGGQGDLLSGSCAVFMHWCTRLKTACPDPGSGVISGWAAARLSRACAAQAFSQYGRSTTTTDLIAQIQPAFQRLYESETCI